MLTNAQALIVELEKPANCPDDDTLCVAQVVQARLKSAVEGLNSLVRAYKWEVATEQLQDRHIAKQDQILAKYEKLDTNNQKLDSNSQKIDTIGQDSARIYEIQHNDDKNTIAKLNEDLNSCRSNQKYVFLAGAVTGGVITWQIKGGGNPFQQFTQSGVTQAQRDYVNFTVMPQTRTEGNLRRALKTLKVNQ